MDKIVEEVLKEYEFINPKLEFIRHNENITYKVIDDDNTYLLRVHKPIEGFSLGLLQRDSNVSEYIKSEMLLLNYFKNEMNTAIQEPVKNKSGELVSILKDGTCASVLKWLDGDTVGNVPVSSKLGDVIGTMIAKLHMCSKKLENKSTYIHKIKRYNYNQALLSEIDKELNNIIKATYIEKEKVMIMKDTLKVINNVMDELDKEEESSGIIHADLSPSNLIFSNYQISPIDFSLSGYGFYYMDLGLMVSNYKDIEIRKSIINAYEEISNRKVPLHYIEAFFAFGVLLFIGCQHEKIHRKDWFDEAINRWCKTIFMPLVNGEPFLNN